MVLLAIIHALIINRLLSNHYWVVKPRQKRKSHGKYNLTFVLSLTYHGKTDISFCNYFVLTFLVKIIIQR